MVAEMIKTQPQFLWTAHAYADEKWQANVLLEIGPNALWKSIQANVSEQEAAVLGAQIIHNPVLPGIVNAHSHAFQRTFAGSTETRSAHGNADDDFWSWRDRMYSAANRITPVEMREIATDLYREFLQAGYTQVCEFHYLHHQAGGAHYLDPHEMSWALCDAAAAVGIGLTLLPVLYQRSGFDTNTLRADQSRFKGTPEWVKRASQEVGNRARSQREIGMLNSGIAVHSLRAADDATIVELTHNHDGPIHIHVAEQTGEVNDCLRVLGRRPVHHLSTLPGFDRRWHLVHATHVVEAEIEMVASAGASLVMCPTTEANLGDGLTPMPHWLAAGVPLGIGSDSHISRDWREELRWLEYGQRLHYRKRNVLGVHAGSTGTHLFDAIAKGGAAQAGMSKWGLKVGARADLLVLDLNASNMRKVEQNYWLDACIFSAPSPTFEHVMVGGRWRIGSNAQQFL
jgi:formimidoylglutamate deiminase